MKVTGWIQLRSVTQFHSLPHHAAKQRLQLPESWLADKPSPSIIDVLNCLQKWYCYFSINCNWCVRISWTAMFSNETASNEQGLCMYFVQLRLNWGQLIICPNVIDSSFSGKFNRCTLSVPSIWLLNVSPILQQIQFPYAVLGRPLQRFQR